MKGRHSMRYKTALSDKLQESFGSVFPLVLIVSVVCFVLIPISVDLMLLFFIGALLLVAGMGLFTLGAEMAMTPIGSLVGSRMMKTRKLWLVLLLSFLLGVAITVSEPDLQVLAVNVPHIDTPVLIVTVAVGVWAVPERLHAAHPVSCLAALAAHLFLRRHLCSGLFVRRRLSGRGL